MTLRHVILSLFIVGPIFIEARGADVAVVVAPTPAPTPTKDARGKREYFLRFGVAQKNKSESLVVFGRVTPEGVHLWTGDLNGALLKYSAIETEDASASRARAIERKKESDAENALGITAPVLQYQFVGRDLKDCLNRREFQTFLKQLPIFQSIISDFDIRAAGEPGRLCALKVKATLENFGFASKVSVGPLKEGGVTLRARIFDTNEDGPHDTENEDADSKTVKGSDGDDLWVELVKGAKVPILVRPDGIFYKTFDPSKLSEVAPLTLNYFGRYGQIKKARLANLPRLFEGDNKFSFEDVRVAQVYSHTIDEVTRVEVPRSVVQYLAEEQPPSEVLTASIVAGQNTAKGNGLKSEGEGFITPANLEATFRLNSKFVAGATLRLPVSVSTDNFTLTHIDGDLNYILIGADPALLTPIQVLGGLGGFYFAGKIKKTEETFTESSYLQEFIGVYARLGLRYRLRNMPLAFEASYRLSPLPETPVNNASTSNILNGGAEYCWNSRECGLFRYQSEKFEISFKSSGRSFREQTFVGFGYRRLLM